MRPSALCLLVASLARPCMAGHCSTDCCVASDDLIWAPADGSVGAPNANFVADVGEVARGQLVFYDFAQNKYGWTDDCASCFGNLATCMSGTCENQCQAEDACIQCVAENCVDTLNTCTAFSPAIDKVAILPECAQDGGECEYPDFPIVAVVVPCAIVGVLLIAGIAFVCYRRKKKSASAPSVSKGTESSV